MAREETRELIRKAQQAELAGDSEAAVQLLAQAAELHASQGEPARAASLYRHCLRLAPSRADLAAALENAEAAEPAVALRAPLELPQRGPTPADPAIDSWCSFCCRPKAEAGPMVAGPAGAFICASCIEAAAQLAGRPGARPLAPAASPPPETGDLIEDAVLLGKSLGWSLADVRSLSPEERARAVARLAPKKKPARKKARRR